MTTDSIDPAAEVAAPETAVAPTGGSGKTVRRLRGVLAALIGIIAVVGLLTSVVAVWARNVLFDPEKVAAAVDTSLQQPEVTDALAIYLTDQIMAAVDAEQFVAGVLPPNLERLAPALVGGVRSFVNDQLEKLLATDEARNVITQLVERTHTKVVRLLRGEIGLSGVSIVEGEVSVNLLPLLSRGLLRVQDLGLFKSADIPVFTADGDPAEQQAELESVLNRQLPDQFGQLVVYQSDKLANAQESLKRAQEAVVLARRALVALLIVTAVAFIGCLLVSVRRGRTALILLLASAATMLLARAVINRVIGEAPTLVTQPGARAAVRSSVTTITQGLLTGVTLIALLGLAAAIGIYLAGNSSVARSVRGRAGAAKTGVRGLVAGRGDAVAIALFGAAVVVILVAGFGVGSLIVAAVLAVLGGWAMTQGDTEAALPPS